MSQYKRFDPEEVRLKPLSKRKHLLSLENWLHLDDPTPLWSHPKLPTLARRMIDARNRGRAVILSMGEYVTERELPASLTEGYDPENACGADARQFGGQPLEDVQKLAILATLEQTGWNKSEAAKILDITRTTLNNKLKKYGL